MTMSFWNDPSRGVPFPKTSFVICPGLTIFQEGTILLGNLQDQHDQVLVMFCACEVGLPHSKTFLSFTQEFQIDTL